MQEHLFDRDQPHILTVFERLRALTDRYPGAFTMAEVADVDAMPVSAKYTAGDRRLHSAYTFQLLHDEFGVDRLRRVVAEAEALMDGRLTYTFNNHDVARAVSRWRRRPELSGDPAALAKLLMACLL